MHSHNITNQPPTYEQVIAEIAQAEAIELNALSYTNSCSRRTDVNFNLPRRMINTRAITSQSQETNNQIANTVNPVLLSTGDIVRNDTNNITFVADLLSMSTTDIITLEQQIQHNLDEYPMPCMQITAFQLKSCLDNALQLHDLTKQEKQVLTDIIAELDFLSPNYPYKKALTITYKIITVLSFLEYRFKHLAQCNNFKKDEVAKFLESRSGHIEIGYNEIIEQFKLPCSLIEIKNLPWDKMQENSTDFEEAMNKICISKYFSLKNNYSFNQLSHRIRRVDGISTLKAKKILIPYTGNLTISQLNRSWALPINLISCSTESFLKNKLTVAHNIGSDRIENDYLMPNSLFEKDLQLICQKEETFISNIQIFDFVNNLYKNKEIIESRFSNFNAIEVALFICLNCTINENKDILFSLEDALKLMFENRHVSSHRVFPKQYSNIRNIDIKNAAWFLYKLKQYLNDYSFDISCNLIKYEINERLPNEEITTSNHREDNLFIKTDTYNPVAERQKIAIAVRQNQKELMRNNINPSRIVNILFALDNEYPQVREVIPQRDEIHFPKKELKWLECYVSCSHLHAGNTKKIIKESIKQFKNS